MFYILYYDMSEDVEFCKAIFKWQWLAYEEVQTPHVLALTRGVKRPVIQDDKGLYAVGPMQLLKKLEEDGLFFT